MFLGDAWFFKYSKTASKPSGSDTGIPYVPRVTLIENFASHAAVQELVDVKPD